MRGRIARPAPLVLSKSLLATNPQFRDLWLAGAISRLGDALYFIGFPFIVRKLTGDDAMVGYVGALEALPFLLIGPYAGTLADRLDRRKIMALSDIASMVILVIFGIFAFFAHGDVPREAFLIAAFALSSARAFFMPAKNAAVPNVVPPEQLINANAFTMGTEQAVWLGAMALSGGFLAALYAASPSWFLISILAVDALSFSLSAYFVARLPRLVPERIVVHRPLREIADGLRYVRTRPELSAQMLSQLGVTLFISPFFTVYIATNERWFGGSPSILALIEIAFVSGMLIVSFLVVRMKLRLVGLAWAYGIAVCGTTILLMGLSPVLWLFWIWNLIAGFAIGFVDIPISTFVQATVPDELRGRVMSLRQLCFTAPAPIGMVLIALLLPRIGLMPAYVLMGFGMAAAGLLPLLSRAFRRAEIPADGYATGTL
ncbi:MAG: hypothetical protein C4320_06935 [Armatimonadota bacterium]